MKKNIYVYVAIILFLSIAVFSFDRSSFGAFNFSKKIAVSSDGFSRILIDKDIYSHSAANLSDFRILSDSNVEVPYFLYPCKSASEELEPVILSKTPTSNGVEISLSLYNIPKPITSFKFYLNNKEYILKAEVKVSIDKKNYSTIKASDKIYSLPGKVTVPCDLVFVEKITQPYVKITLTPIIATIEPGDIKKITYFADENIDSTIQNQESTIISNFIENSKNTIIIDNGYVNAPIDEIQFETSKKNFSAKIDLFGSNDEANWNKIGTSFEIYSYKISSESIIDKAVKPGKNHFKLLKAIVTGYGTSEPLIESVQIRYIPEYAIFTSVHSSKYRAVWGCDSIGNPNYDTKKLKTLIDYDKIQTAHWN